jgi:hypothetical protein
MTRRCLVCSHHNTMPARYKSNQTCTRYIHRTRNRVATSRTGQDASRGRAQRECRYCACTSRP